MGMMINRRRVCGGKSLPYDAEVEYLENVSGGYIIFDLPYFADYEIDVFVRRNIANYTLQGNTFSGRQWNLCRNGNAGKWRLRCETQVLDTEIPINIRHKIKMFQGEVFCDNVKIGEISRNTMTTNSRYTQLFSSRYAETVVYSLRLYDINGVMIVDAIPVRVGQTGYMYDKVSGQLFGNAGTGSFILGPDK